MKSHSWQGRQYIKGGEGYGNSIQRFITAADRLSEYTSSDVDLGVDYAFDTLEAVSREDTVWSLVFDPVNLRVYFHSIRNPQIRFLGFQDLDFSCRTPAKMLDIHADISGDINNDLDNYSHTAGFRHAIIFFTQYEGFSMSPFLVNTLLKGMESFPCQEGKIDSEMSLQRYHPLVPPTFIWAGLTIWRLYWPIGVLVLVFSLACFVWLMTTNRQKR